MSLFDSASLVVTPNGYKEDKLYSIKPTDGSGDLVVTRATTATRVNSAGLIEECPYNLLTYSQDFDNAAWSKQNCTITANSVVAPDSNTTADSLIASNGTGTYKGFYITQQTAASKTFSFYAKKGNKDWAMLLGYNGNNNVWFNVSNGTLGTIGSNFINATIDSVGNGWYRCSATLNSSITLEPNIGIYTSNADNSTSCTGDGTTVSLYLWGAQLVSGTSAKEYFPTTDRLNVPRLDYTNSTCPSILVEPQRTNLFSYSEQFDNAYWGKTNMVIVANNTTAPDGTNTADRATASLYPSTSITKTNLLTATNYTLSVYVKANSVSTFRLDLVTGGFAAGSNCIFNLNTLATTITNYGSTTGTTAFITNVGNGWYRCSLTVLTTAVIYFAQLLPAANGSVYLWGAQLEAGSYATSYIPTVASSVTRNADVISKTGISSLIGQTEGTLFVDFYANGKYAASGSEASNLIATLSDGTTSNWLGLNLYLGEIDSTIVTSGSTQFFYNAPSQLPYGRNKLAISYKQNDIALYLNGNLIASDSSANIPAMSKLNLGSFLDNQYQYNNGINTAALWKTRLTNTELATLTTI